MGRLAPSRPSLAEQRDDRYEVVIVRYGTRRTVRSDVYLNYGVYGDDDAPIDMDYFIWVVRNAYRTILVDTGYSVAGGASRGRTPGLGPRGPAGAACPRTVAAASARCSLGPVAGSGPGRRAVPRVERRPTLGAREDSPRVVDLAHALGRLWAALMLVAALSSFWILELRDGAGLSVIHVLSAWTIVSLAAALWFIRRGNVRAHKRFMIGTYLGLVGAGLGALAPGRTLYLFFFA